MQPTAKEGCFNAALDAIERQAARAMDVPQTEPYPNGQEPESVQNLRLIAAASCLLEALKQITADERTPTGIVSIARAAIAKAER